ncbi:MAG: MMPL family transporter, partial [Thermoplasmata archaeon]
MDMWLGKIKSFTKKIDNKIDDTLNKYFEAPSRREYSFTSRISRYKRTAGASIKGLDGFGEAYLERITGKTGGGISGAKILTSKPLLILIIITLITGIIGSQAPLMIQSIRGDLEIYLPPDDPSTKDIKEVREDFSTDAMIIYVELPKDSRRNITDYEVLLEMSHVEGDDHYNDPDKVLDWNRDGTGEGDGIITVLSISSIIKVLHQTASNIANSTLPSGSVPQAEYIIPEDQETIDSYVEQLNKGGALSSLVKDDNGDGIFDTAVIMIMLSAKYVTYKDVPKMVEKVNSVIKKNAKLTKMTNTGPTTMMNSMQKRSVAEFTKVIPFVIAALMLTLYYFHRSWKVWFVALMPVSYALLMTFGLVGMFRQHFVIATQVVLSAPILLALGVSYGLYISNRFNELKKGSVRDRVEEAIKSQFWAITLSAVTTGIGFASLMIGTLPPIATLGFVLTLGIMLTYVLTIVMVPSIILLIGYKKNAKFSNWETFATTPLSHRKKIILTAVAITMISVVWCMPLVKFNADYLAMAPQDEPAVIKMNEYSKKFGGGQLGMVIVRTEDLKDPNSGSATLRIMNQTQTYMQEVPNTKSISIVDIMKAIAIKGEYLEKAPISDELKDMLIERLVGKSFYDAIQSSIPNSVKAWLLDVLFDSIPVELRSMLVKYDYSKALIYVLMPMMDIEQTR